MLGNSGIGLLFEIKARGDQARREFTETRAHAQRETAQITTGFKGAEAGSTSFGASVGASALKVAGYAAAVAGAVGSLYAFVSAATESAAKLKDLSDQTGIQVETLSALSNSAEDTGGSIETVSNALVIFQKNQFAADSGNKKLSATFKALNIDTKDNEKGLRDAFRALGSMEEGSKQTALAMQIFGKSGKEVLAIIRDTNGDLDAAIKKYDELGELIDTETANAADHFADTMAGVERRLGAVAREVAVNLIPTLEALAFALENVVRLWNLVGGIIPVFSGAGIMGDIGKQSMSTAQMVIDAVNGKRGPRGDFDIPTGSGGRRGGGGAKKDAAFEAAMKKAKQEEQAAREVQAANEDRLRREREREIISIEEYASKKIEYARAHFNTTIDLINAELIALQNSKKTKEEIAARELELDVETEKAKRELTEAEERAETERDDRLVKAKQNARRREVQMQEEASERLIAMYRRQADDQVLSRSGAEELVLQLVRESYARRKKLLEDELEDTAEFSDRYAEILHELILLEGERAQAVVDATRRINEARGAERNARLDEAAGFPDVNRGPYGDDPFFGLGEPPDIRPHVSALQTLKEIGRDALGSLAQGVGEYVGAWASGANIVGQSVRKIVGSVIASVAAQAAVQAVMFTAYGIAALTPWGAAIYGPAAIWFKAAAVMAGVAVVAAGLGRVVSGSAGAQGSVGAGASGGVGAAEPRDYRFSYNSQPQPSPTAERQGSRFEQTFGFPMERVVRALERLETAPAGHVVTVGARDLSAQQAIGVAVIEHSNSDHGFNQSMLNNLGFAR